MQMIDLKMQYHCWCIEEYITLESFVGCCVFSEWESMGAEFWGYLLHSNSCVCFQTLISNWHGNLGLLSLRSSA